MSTYLATAEEARAAILRKRAEEVIRNLAKRKISGAFVSTAAEAVVAACLLIPEGALVGLGGSVTLPSSGLLDALRRMNIRLLDRYREGISKDEVDRMRLEGMLADVFISGCNAVTLDGRLVNADGIGNRVAAMIYGPHKVILLAGMNKVVPTLDDAFRRIRGLAAPMDSLLVKVDTPCAKKGFCVEAGCFPPNKLCNAWTVIEGSWFADRLHVILIGQDLGF